MFSYYLTMPGNLEGYLTENLYRLLEISEESKKVNYLSYLAVGHITSNCRETLLNWVLDLSSNLNISVSTGLLACSYIDRFLSSRPNFQHSVLELVGITALSLAMKFAEGKILTPNSIYTMLDYRFSIDAIVTTELFILKELEWNLSIPSPCELIDCLIEYSFDYPCTGRIIEFCHSFAVLCYLDTETVASGNFNLAIASIVLSLDHLAYNELRTDWLLSLKESFVFDSEKLEITVKRVLSKLNLFQKQ
ncbi:hypothetical protein SteCoe_16407 [Stentor coeruleus]|uniref:Cyclin-like domain-containing protein n=1 Tax=Stentor coeruleus TaxID=5963 RepID=A0A1R2C1E4_9CILI|nr:hypothetical protein SteCoe_16407 [Stentor coeruleus]